MKKKTYIILSIAIVVILIIGTTFALVYFRGETSNVNLTVSTDIGQYINYVNGNAMISGDTLNLGSDYTSGISTEIEFWKKEEAKNLDLFGHIYLDIDVGSEDLLNSSALKWAIEINNVLIGEGTFIGYDEGDSVPVLVNHKLLQQSSKYKIYVWLDELEILNASSGASLVVTVRCEATDGEFNKFGGSHDFDYSGKIEVVTLKPGSYTLEVWGAEGGYGLSNLYRGGYGGYSVGKITFTDITELYVVVGGKGNSGLTRVTTVNSGGYNGGGNSYGTTDRYTGSGGGATHISLVKGRLSTLSANINDILIVAGGGGAGTFQNASSYGYGGDGGGYIGNSGYSKNTSYKVGTGGTQSLGGTGHLDGLFGHGGNAIKGAIGGGGGFYGGGVGQITAGGGGGSGYIGNPLLTNKSMYCYECIESASVDTYTVSTTDVSEIANSNQAKKGNGYARITPLKSTPFIKILDRKNIDFQFDYDFKLNIINNIPEGYAVIYSTYDNANTLSIGEYQIRYIVEDTIGNEYIYYQKIEIV